MAFKKKNHVYTYMYIQLLKYVHVFNLKVYNVPMLC